MIFCSVGMGGESKDFAGELYEALARRRNITAANGITVEELRIYWEDMTNQDIDSRLQIFFDMCGTFFLSLTLAQLEPTPKLVSFLFFSSQTNVSGKVYIFQNFQV